MTLPEAIEIKRRELAKHLGRASLATSIRLGDKKAHADQLGIEALERIKRDRDYSNSVVVPELLPSEGEK